MLQQRHVRKVDKVIYINRVPQEPEKDDTCGAKEAVLFILFLVFLAVALPGFQ